MDFLKDFASAITDQIRERLSNPLLGAFALAWLAWNSRLVMVALGDGTVADKIKYIDQVLYSFAFAKAAYGVLLPLVSAVAFVFVYPYVNRRIMTFHRAQQTLTLNQLTAIDQTAVLTQEQRDRLVQRYKAREEDLQATITRLQAENGDLEAALRAASSQLKATHEPQDGPADGDEAPGTSLPPAAESSSAVAVARAQWRELTEHEALKSLVDFPPVTISTDRLRLAGPATRKSLATNGLQGLEVALLYGLRQGPRTGESLSKQLESFPYLIDTAFNSLQRLELVEGQLMRDDRAGFTLTAAGKEVLIAALESLGLALR
ncbi:hypothetical protein ABT392_15485 [Paucibacter sp. JuS9]|uniref:hypothetical protein n=1 Tax=Paucibacter sp. JuS9 TaxID=3228748 RepID=UPI003757E470